MITSESEKSVKAITQAPKAANKFKVDWIASTFILGVHIASIAAFFTFSWQALLVCIVLHWITGGLGITLAYHRLLTHRSFQVPRFLEYTLSLLGTLACQSGPVTWVAAHRAHHAYSDQEQDPHSPLKGFFWAHMGWCLSKNPFIDTDDAKKRFAPDIYADKGHQIIEKGILVWTLLLAAGLYALGGWSFVIYGIPVRLVLVYHCTWLVNSAAHIWGYRTYATTDQSTNLWWVALLTYGEGWHNNHHAFQQSARHGLKWWEFDSTYLMIKVLEFFQLAKAVKIPTAHQLNSRSV